MQPARSQPHLGQHETVTAWSDQMVLRYSDVLEQHLGMVAAAAVFDVWVVHRRDVPQNRQTWCVLLHHDH